MDAQGIFNKVATHLVNQDKRATMVRDIGTSGTGINEKVVCVYRHPNGTQCAIGCLIPDDRYCGDLEGKGVRMLMDHNVLPGIASEHLNLLEGLQEIHDLCHPADWAQLLKRLAQNRGLEYRNLACLYPFRGASA